MSTLKVGAIQSTTGNAAITVANTGLITANNAIVDSAKPSFFARGSTGSWQSVSSGGLVAGLNTTDHNIGNHYDTSNGRFIVPITGVYCFQFNMYIKQNNTTASFSIYHNGSEFQSTGGFAQIRVSRQDGDANDETIGCSWTYKYTANDYLEIRSSGQTSEYVPIRSYFSGFFVG